MSGEQVVRILDETVDWYRTLGTQPGYAPPLPGFVAEKNRALVPRRRNRGLHVRNGIGVAGHLRRLDHGRPRGRQASGGVFKQIAGVDLAWHEITLSLPPGSDPGKIKDELVEAVNRAIQDYREDIVRQTREIQRASSSHATKGPATADPQPQVQLRFSAAGVFL